MRCLIENNILTIPRNLVKTKKTNSFCDMRMVTEALFNTIVETLSFDLLSKQPIFYLSLLFRIIYICVANQNNKGFLFKLRTLTISGNMLCLEEKKTTCLIMGLILRVSITIQVICGACFPNGLLSGYSYRCYAIMV